MDYEKVRKDEKMRKLMKTYEFRILEICRRPTDQREVMIKLFLNTNRSDYTDIFLTNTNRSNCTNAEGIASECENEVAICFICVYRLDPCSLLSRIIEFQNFYFEHAEVTLSQHKKCTSSFRSTLKFSYFGCAEVTSSWKNSNKFGFFTRLFVTLAAPKLLRLGKDQTSLAFHSTFRNFAGEKGI